MDSTAKNQADFKVFQDFQKFRELLREEETPKNGAGQLHPESSTMEDNGFYRSGRGFFFQVVYTENREGSEADIKNIEALITKLAVSQEKDRDMARNLSKTQLDKKIQEVQEKLRTTEYDYFVIFIQAHGHSDGGGRAYIKVPINQVDADPFKTEGEVKLYLSDILKPFTNTTSFDALNGKPRIGIVQACRGSGGNETDADNNTVSDRATYVPNVADFAVISAAVEDTFAVRSPVDGSFFIRTFCEVVTANQAMLLIDVFHSVAKKLQGASQRVQIAGGETRNVFTVPCFCHYSLDKHFRFKAQ